MDYDDMSRLALRSAVLVLQSRLNDAIREELGGTYSITVDSDTSRFPMPEYRVRIDWTCDPARVESLVQRVFQEVAFVKRTLLSPNQMERVRDVLLRDLEKAVQDNGYVLNQIVRKYEDGESDTLATLNQQPSQIEALTGAAVQRAAQRYFDTANYVKVTLMPERR
jgi:zinc protease